MSLVKEYAELQAQMDLAYNGTSLRQAAEDVLGETPAGEPTTFIATSESGAGLAAACAALYEGPATWVRVNLLVPVDLPASTQNVVVEMVNGGEAWRQALVRRIRAHTLIVPDLVEEQVALA